MATKYLGWIFTQKNKGFTDSFFVMPNGQKSQYMGAGNEGAEKSVAFFDKLAGKPVKLDDSMGFLGLRVYTEEEGTEG